MKYLLLILLVASCGQNCKSRRNRRKNNYTNWRKINAICSQRSYQNRCTHTVSASKLVAQDFYSYHCLSQYRVCRIEERQQ